MRRVQINRACRLASLALVSGMPLALAGSRDESQLQSRFAEFSRGAPGSVQRHLVLARPQTPLPVSAQRVDVATNESASWIRTVLRSEFIPADLESGIEAIPAGLPGVERSDRVKPAFRFDCTRVEFDAGEQQFQIVQDYMMIAIFVQSSEYEQRIGDGAPMRLSGILRDWTTKLFRHAEVSLYFRPVRVTDFGVDMPARWDAWHASDKRWGPATLTPPKGWEDGVLQPDEARDYGTHNPELERKIRQMDSSIPDIEAQGASHYWWSRVYAATDGHVLLYAVPKARGVFQTGEIGEVPDWFRIAGPDEIPKFESKVAPESKQ